MLLNSVTSKSEVIDIVKLFPEQDGSILYTQLAMVKKIIDNDCEGLTRSWHHCNQPQRLPVVRMLFPQLETLVRLLLTIPCMRHAVAQKLKKAFLNWSSSENSHAELNMTRDQARLNHFAIFHVNQLKSHRPRYRVVASVGLFTPEYVSKFVEYLRK